MKRFNLFPAIIFVLLGLNFLIVGITVFAANSDGGAAIEPDYYQKALHWDEHRAQERRSLALGWDVRADLTRRDGALALRVHVHDAAGAAISGASVHATVFRSAEARRRFTLELRETNTPGEYGAAVPSGAAGAWQVELAVAARGNEYSRVLTAFAEREP